MRTFFRKKARYAIILFQRRKVITQLMVLVYDSKDAPRPCLSNALTLRSFEQFLVSLRAQLWTLSSRKTSQNTSVDELFQNFIRKKIVKNCIFLLVFGTFSSTKTQKCHSIVICTWYKKVHRSVRLTVKSFYIQKH